jgi:hypothetical protein
MVDRRVAPAETIEDTAHTILHHVGELASLLRPQLALLSGRERDVREALERFAFNRFTNWGLRVGDDVREEGTWSQKANWFLHGYGPEQRMEFERRFAGLERESMLQVIRGFCRERYGRDVRSVLAFGGYLYGIIPQPDDLDLAVVVEDAHAVENDLTLQYARLAEIIKYPRRPDRKIGLTVIGMNQINGSTQNSTVLRTAVIAGTTAVSLYGPPYQLAPVPVSVMLYHAIEIVTWGFKLCFETSPQAHARALWRLIEATYVLQYINDTNSS